LTPIASLSVCFDTNMNDFVDTLPKYHPRKARSGRALVSGFDMSRKSSPYASLLPCKSEFVIVYIRLGTSAPARTVKKDRNSKEKKHASKWKGTSGGPKPANKLSILREQGGARSSSNPPTPTETSSSEEESSSDEESEYEEDMIHQPFPVEPLKDVSEVSYNSDPKSSRG
jgi:hypothetical protein